MLAAIVQNWCAKYLASQICIYIFDLKNCRRCTALSTDLDGNISGRRTHGLTEELISAFEPDILWDEYGIDADIIVRP
jgi:hypothetical protein